MIIGVSILSLKNEPFRKKEIFFDQKYSTIKDLIRKIDLDYDSNIENEIMINGSLKDNYVIFKNGYSIGSLDNLETPISDGDKIFMTILIFGG